MLFGEHVIPDWKALVELIIDITLDIMSLVSPQVKALKIITNTVFVSKLLFFSASIVDSLSELASKYLDDYIERSDMADQLDLMTWPMDIYETANKIVEGLVDTFNVTNIGDITIYNKIEKQDTYKVIFENESYRLFMQDILDLCQ